MEERIVLRTTSNLSYAGKIYAKSYEGQKGIVLKPSDRSEIKVWVPKNEISCIITIGGNIIEGRMLDDEF